MPRSRGIEFALAAGSRVGAGHPHVVEGFGDGRQPGSGGKGQAGGPVGGGGHDQRTRGVPDEVAGVFKLGGVLIGTLFAELDESQIVHTLALDRIERPGSRVWVKGCNLCATRQDVEQAESEPQAHESQHAQGEGCNVNQEFPPEAETADRGAIGSVRRRHRRSALHPFRRTARIPPLRPESKAGPCASAPPTRC